MMDIINYNCICLRLPGVFIMQYIVELFVYIVRIISKSRESTLSPDLKDLSIFVVPKFHFLWTDLRLDRAAPQAFDNLFLKTDSSKHLIINEIPLSEVKRPRGRAVSAPDFGSRGRGFESRWRRDSSRTLTALYCTEPFMFTLPSTRNDWNTVEGMVYRKEHKDLF